MNRTQRLKKLIGIAAAAAMIVGCGSSAGSASGGAARSSASQALESDSDVIIANIIDNADPNASGGSSNAEDGSAASGTTASGTERVDPASTGTHSGEGSAADSASRADNGSAADAGEQPDGDSGSDTGEQPDSGSAGDSDSRPSAEADSNTISQSASQVTLPSDNTNELRVREILRNYKQDTSAMVLDDTAWHYDEEYEFYYQLEIPYCANPATDGEVLGIYVPEPYMDAEENADGTLTCVVDKDSEINGYTGVTAPVVFPVNSEHFEAQEAQRSFSPENIAEYTGRGYICVLAGLRGSANELNRASGNTVCGGAPWAVTDLKAAIRYCRLNSGVIPGDMGAVFVCGTLAGGTLSEIAGASGDSPLYYAYLTQIGAAMYDLDGEYISDAIYGAAALDSSALPEMADAAYEWESGQYSTDGSRAENTWTGALSADLAAEYADYINELGLTNESGTALLIEEGSSGLLTDGTYCDYLEEVLEDSIETSAAEMEEAVSDFIYMIDPDEEFLTWDAESESVEITDLTQFFMTKRPASLSCTAFDVEDDTGVYNDLFGTSESDLRHFDGVLQTLINAHATTYSRLEGWNASLADAFANDLAAADEIGTDTRTRVNMYSPIYFINENEGGAGTANTASHFFIRADISDANTPLTPQINLYLSLEGAGTDAVLELLWDQDYVSYASPADAAAWIERVMES